MLKKSMDQCVGIDRFKIWFHQWMTTSPMGTVPTAIKKYLSTESNRLLRDRSSKILHHPRLIEYPLL